MICMEELRNIDFQHQNTSPNGHCFISLCDMANLKLNETWTCMPLQNSENLTFHATPLKKIQWFKNHLISAKFVKVLWC